MKRSMVYWILVLVVGLAGCGGESSEPDTRPTPIPRPTLPFEERIQYDAGLAENPLQMAIRPVETVRERVHLILANALEVPLASVTQGASLREDLGASETLSALDAPLERDFGVVFVAGDIETIETVADLVRYVQRRIGEQVSKEIFERSGLYVDVVPVDTYGEALRGLCDSDSGIVTIPWLDGITYRAAVAQSCGEPALQVAVSEIAREPEFSAITLAEVVPTATPEVTPDVEMTAEATPEETEAPLEADATTVPTTTPEPTDTPAASDVPEATLTPEPTSIPSPTPDPMTMLRTGRGGVMVFNAAFGGTAMSIVEGRTYCRLSVDDFFSWFVPLIVADFNGVDLIRAPANILEFDTTDALVDALIDGACAATGLSRDTLDQLEDTDGLRIGTSSIAFPYGIFFYPLEVGLGVRLSLSEHLTAMGEESRPLRLLLGQDAVLAAGLEDFGELDVFMSQTGLDFAQLGN